MDNSNLKKLSQDDYLPCEVYNGKTYSDEGIYKFTENGKFYFSLMENGNVILRSEGYTSESGRENGIGSILKNKDNEDLYKVLKLDDGNWALSLEALNHQEIARSCAFATEEEARNLLPGARAKAREALLLKASLDAEKNNENEIDEYLVCGEYEERINERSADHPNFMQFKHPSTNKYYFAWVTPDNKIILRSEGYASEASRDHGIISVLKNKEIEERFKIEEKRGLYYLVLNSGNLQEIGRSCPAKSEAELWALIKPPIVEPVLAAAGAVVAMNTNINEDKEDDYLFCSEYHGHLVQDTKNKIALFKHGNGKYYFAVYEDNGTVKLRSEGFSSPAERDLELKSVITYVNNRENYTSIEKAGYQIKILKDHTGREIGRTCPKKIAIAAAPVAAAIPAPEVKAVGGGFKWWWLVGLLLLLGLFFYWKSCNKTEVVAPAPAVDSSVSAVPVVKDTDGDGINDDVDKCPNLAGIADNLGCPEMILYYKRDEGTLSADDTVNLDKVVTFLNNNPNVHVILEGHTSTLGEADYNQKLSEKRANKSVAYLVSKGIDANRLKAVGYGEQFPIGDNNTEEGRAKSRRTVIKADK